jgi:hypothetical protein
VRLRIRPIIIFYTVLFNIILLFNVFFRTTCRAGRLEHAFRFFLYVRWIAKLWVCIQAPAMLSWDQSNLYSYTNEGYLQSLRLS